MAATMSYSELLRRAMLDAHSIQCFLWADEDWIDQPFDSRDWASAFQKRVDAIRSIDRSRPSWKVELRKRLLQQASLSLKAIMALDNDNKNL
jgi:hypothetical protein